MSSEGRICELDQEFSVWDLSNKPSCILWRVCWSPSVQFAFMRQQTNKGALKACEVRDWNRGKKTFPILPSLKLMCIKRAAVLGPEKRCPCTSEHHVSSITDKLNVKIILFKIDLHIYFSILTFWGIQIMVPKPTDCSECLSWVNCGNKGPLLYPSYTLFPLIPT